MELLMVDLMVEDALLKALLMRCGFGAPSDYSHDSLFRPFDPLVDVNCMVDSQYANGANVDCCFCRSVLCYVFRSFLSFLSLLVFDYVCCF